MVIKDKDVSVSDMVDFANSESLLLKRRNNGIRLSDYQVSVLDRNGLNYLKYSNIHDLLFDIEEILNSDYDEELDLVSSQIAEYIYYSETKK